MTLHEMLVDELKDLYHAEKQLTKALPKMAKAASHEELREAFETHLEETQEHVTRLEGVFDSLDERVKAKACPGMAGIIEEGSEKIHEQEPGPVLDAVLIAAAQRAEHYEIGAYGTCIEWARLMGHGEAAALLEQTLEEEKAADKKLTSLAESGINSAALAEGGDEAGEEGDEEMEMAGASRGRGTSSARGSRRQSSGTTSSRSRASEKKRR
jgi:ferritin-like metal-binding protein YciE